MRKTKWQRKANWDPLSFLRFILEKQEATHSHYKQQWQEDGRTRFTSIIMLDLELQFVMKAAVIRPSSIRPEETKSRYIITRFLIKTFSNWCNKKWFFIRSIPIITWHTSGLSHHTIIDMEVNVKQLKKALLPPIRLSATISSDN